MSTTDKCFFCEVMFAVPAAIACSDVGDVADAKAYLAAAETSAELWQGTAWQAAILEARVHLARAEGEDEVAERLLAEAAAIFDDAGQPRDAARCRSAAQADLKGAGAGTKRLTGSPARGVHTRHSS